MQDMKKRLILGAAWIGASRVAISLIGFVSTMVLARILTPEDFGLVAIATTVMAVLTALTQLSLASALVQRQTVEDDHIHTAFTLNLLRAIAIGAILAAMAAPIAQIYKDDRLIGIVLVLAGSSILSGVSSPRLVMLSRQLVFWQQFVVNAPQKLVGFIVSLSLALATDSYWAIIIGNLAASAFGVAASYWVAPYRPVFRLNRARELFSFSAWLSLGAVVTTLSWRLDQLLIGYFLGKPVLGAYSVGDNLASLPTREAMAPLAQTFFPGFSRLTDQPARLRHAYQLAQTSLCVIAFPVGVGFAVVADPLIRLMMGPQWHSAIIMVQVISVVVCAQGLSNNLQPLAMAMGQTRTLFARDSIALAIRLPMLLGGMIFFGIAGVLAARAVSASIGILINLSFVRRLIGVSLFDQLASNWRAFTSTLVMAAAASGAGWAFGEATTHGELTAKLTAMVGAGGLSYPICLGLLWLASSKPSGPETEVFKLLDRVRRRVIR
jgi:O-antigen/teichoic acid export membrane protein